MSMRLKTADVSIIKEKMRTKKSTYAPIVDAFVNSGELCCEVIGFTSKNPSNVTLSLNKVIKQKNMLNVRAHTVRDRVYLAKEVSE